VLAALNEAFQMDKQNGLYFTIWYGVFDRNTRELVFGAAGHPPALLRSPGGEIRELSVINMIIGGIPGLPYEEVSTTIPEGSVLYIFSDGVYEITRPDGSMWDLAGLRAWLETPPVTAASEIDVLYRHAQELHGAPVLEDDFSVLKAIFS
jgi:sigma-B regulation protein RsbU (phosphoserine phosphatase)